MEKTRSETKDRGFGQKENNRNLTPAGNCFSGEFSCLLGSTEIDRYK